MKERIHRIYERIQEAARSCNRNAEDIRLIAVSKTQPVAVIREAIQNGMTVLGENYIQEARKKIGAIPEHSVSWHFIGHLQRNKAKHAVELFDLIHTVDSVKLARELDRQAKRINKKQSVLIQVNVGMESSKSGIHPDQALEITEEISTLENLRIQGLMTIPPLYNQPERVAPYFRQLRELRDRIRAKSIPDVAMTELSMGMTGDFEVAIREGATLIRIGTAIFGERT